MSLRESIEEYLNLLVKLGFSYKTDEIIEMVTDLDSLVDYCEKSGKKIGIINRNDYNIHLADLVRDKHGQLFVYERIVKAVQGNSVVIMPFEGEKLVLLKQFRHALGDYQYAFPRGFGEAGLTPEENAQKEVREELGCRSYNYTFLGYIVADSGLCGEKVCAFSCGIVDPITERGYENIASHIKVTEKEFVAMIKDGLINDGFTLSAFSLYKSVK